MARRRGRLVCTLDHCAVLPRIRREAGQSFDWTNAPLPPPPPRLMRVTHDPDKSLLSFLVVPWDILSQIFQHSAAVDICPSAKTSNHHPFHKKYPPEIIQTLIHLKFIQKSFHLKITGSLIHLNINPSKIHPTNHQSKNLSIHYPLPARDALYLSWSNCRRIALMSQKTLPLQVGSLVLFPLASCGVQCSLVRVRVWRLTFLKFFQPSTAATSLMGLFTFIVIFIVIFLVR